MFRTLRSTFTFHLSLYPKTGVLVSSGSIPFDPTLPDISFMRARINGKNVPFIPGSSLKGPIRMYSESFLRSLSDENKDRYACNISGRSCDKDINRKWSVEEKYERSCLACRIFGNTLLASVVRFEDLFPFRDITEIDEEKIREIENSIAVRPGVGIDRAKGSVKGGALFSYEAVTFPFYGRMMMKNPEKWQVGLIFKAFEAANMGIIRFGRNKSRGMGWMEVKVEKVEIFSPSSKIVFTKFENGKFSSLSADPEEMGINDRFENGFIVLEGEDIEKLKGWTLENLENEIREAVGGVKV